MIQVFESLFRPHERSVFCKECRCGLMGRVSIHFSQYLNRGDSTDPIMSSAYWLSECAQGHTIKQPVDRNVAYILNNPNDFVQYGDPRFAKLYPVEYARLKAEEDQKKIESEEIEEATENSDKDLVRTFGRDAQEALESLKEKYPDWYKVKPKAQFKQKRTGLKPRFMK